jgi:hypothetical protein
MTFIYDEPDPKSRATLNAAPGGEEIGFFEGMSETFTIQAKARNTDAYNELLKGQMQPIIERLKEATGNSYINPGNYGGMSSAIGQNEKMQKWALGRVLKGMQDNPGLFPETAYQGMTPETIDAAIKERAKSEIERGEDINARLTGMGSIGAFVGEVGGFAVDDNFLELNLTGGLAANIGKSFAKRVLYQGLASAGIEGVLQTGVKDWFDEIGVEYTAADFWYNVAAAGTLGAAIPVAGAGVGRAYNFTSDQISRGLDALAGNGYLSQRDVNMAKTALTDEDILSEAPTQYPDMDPLEAEIKVEQDTADLYAGKTPEFEGVRDPAKAEPTAREIDTADPTALDPEIDALADDDIIVIDAPQDGAPLQLTGAELKQQVAQDNSMLDRLRGCVLK